jgi:hypothetical protein
MVHQPATPARMRRHVRLHSTYAIEWGQMAGESCGVTCTWNASDLVMLLPRVTPLGISTPTGNGIVYF